MAASKSSTPVKKVNSNELASLQTYTSVSRARLKSLYSDFSLQKQSNPAGYQSNIDWWKRTLFSLLSTGRQPSSQDALILHAKSALVDGLRCEELGVGKPLSMGSVVTELSASGQVMPLTTFHSTSQSIYYPGSLPVRIASYIVGKPLWWALEQLSLVGEGNESEEKRWKRVQGDYVVVPLLEQAADSIIEYYQSEANLSLADSLYDMDTFRAKFASRALPGVTLSSVDITALIKFLERDRKVLVTSHNVVKFVDNQTAESERVVTQVDSGVLELKLAVAKLEAQIEEIQKQIEDRAEKITEQLKQKRKEMAMFYLKSRKQLEDLLSKRLKSLETLESTLLQVESAAGNIEIMKTYETSTSTLRTLLSHPLLQRDKVDATMAALEEATADHKEIDDAIRLGGEGVAVANGTVIDNDEIEAEIQRMMAEKEREEAEERERQAIEKAHKEKEERERKEKEAEGERKREELRRREEEEREIKKILVESGRGTPVSAEDDKIWEERWLAAQAEKAAQAQRDREAENRRRARWEEEDAAKAQTA